MPPAFQASPAAGTHPLIERLFHQPGCRNVSADGFEAYIHQSGETVLFFSEDPLRYGETLDFAVIIPEIAKACVRPFRIGVLLPQLAHEMAGRFAVQRWPALVFLRAGEFLGVIEGLRDWEEFVALANQLLTGPARPAPTKVIPINAGNARACH
jgi:hydrogenase-1 operon protein HyaE